MCLIVDANVAHLLFGPSRDVEAEPIWRWLHDRDGIIVYGGLLANELGTNHGARRLLVELGRQGKAALVPRTEVEREQAVVELLGLCTSDDPHVVALARVSGARVLFTNDRALMDDFRNRRLVTPKGKIYQRAKHASLLGHRRGCRAEVGVK